MVNNQKRYIISNGRIAPFPLKQYGKSIIVDKKGVIAGYTFLAVCIPVIVPVFVSAILAYIIPKNWSVRI
jgi:hypothetical protein